MTAPSSVDRLRQAIADTLSIDAQGLQAAIGQLVVATSADYPAAGPQERSLHSSAVRTTVLLADRIPAGQEAQALAQEIVRHHGQEAAQAVLGERAAELLGDEAPADFTECAAAKLSPKSDQNLLRSDGTLRGVIFGRAQGKRGPCLQVALPSHGLNKSLGIEGRDFHKLYAQVVALVATAKEVPADSPAYRSMLETKTAFLRVNGLELETVSYVQARTADMVKEDAIAHPCELINSPTSADRDAHTSIPASQPPPMELGEFGWPVSRPVLGFTTSGEPVLVTFEQPDEDAPETVKIRSKDSERWDMTDKITCWTSLPELRPIPVPPAMHADGEAHREQRSNFTH